MLEHILDGGLVMIPLLLLSIVAIAVIIDRLGVFRIAQADLHDMRQGVTNHVEKGELDQAIAICEKFQGPIPAVVMAGLVKFKKLLQHGGMSLDEVKTDVEETMKDYAPHAMDLLEHRLNLLTMIAGTSPLLGMTGTVIGMIQSFAALSSGGMDAAEVGTGISVALVTTAAGLVIAIPAVVAYNIFTRKLDQTMLDMEETASELMEVIKLGYTQEG